MKIGYIEIKRTVNKQFCVVTYGGNGEALSPSETVKRMASAYINIISQMKVYNGTFCKVKDTTGKQEVWYLLFLDGSKEVIETDKLSKAIRKKQGTYDYSK